MPSGNIKVVEPYGALAWYGTPPAPAKMETMFGDIIHIYLQHPLDHCRQNCGADLLRAAPIMLCIGRQEFMHQEWQFLVSKKADLY